MSISSFIYLASIMDRLGVLLILITIAGCLAIVVIAIVFLASLATYGDSYGEKRKLDDYLWPKILAANYWKLILAGLLFIHIANVFRPSQQTMYAIAAAQVGEQVIKSDAVQGIANDSLKALQQWIKKQLEPEEKKT